MLLCEYEYDTSFSNLRIRDYCHPNYVLNITSSDQLRWFPLPDSYSSGRIYSAVDNLSLSKSGSISSEEKFGKPSNCSIMDVEELISSSPLGLEEPSLSKIAFCMKCIKSSSLRSGSISINPVGTPVVLLLKLESDVMWARTLVVLSLTLESDVVELLLFELVDVVEGK